jgi:hypothetical protein
MYVACRLTSLLCAAHLNKQHEPGLASHTLAQTLTTVDVGLHCSPHSPLQGVSGCRPAATDLAGALEQHDLFLYFGHGSGEQYLPLSGLRRLARCAGGVLLGCSSGRLRSNGMYEPSGPVLGYLMAGERRAGHTAPSCISAHNVACACVRTRML